MENEKQIKNSFERIRENENSVLYGSDNLANTLAKKIKKSADEKHWTYFTLHFKTAKKSVNGNYSERIEKQNLNR